MRGLRGRLLLAVTLGVVCLVGGGAAIALGTRRDRPPAAVSTTGAQPETWTIDLAAKLGPDGDYRDPTRRDRSAAAAAFRQLLAAPHGADTALRAFRSAGFTVVRGTDRATARPFVAIICELGSCPGWGVLLVDLSAPIRLAIEVPHPRSDRNTERIGLDLYRKVPGSVLVMAGAHRRAADGAADVAHNASSMFNAFATVAADRGIAQVQLHGFADENRPKTHVVVSTGRDSASAAGLRVVATASASGLLPCAAWQEDCGQLEGTTNVQGRYAADHQAAFLHIEVSAAVRDSGVLRTTLVEDLAESDLPGA